MGFFGVGGVGYASQDGHCELDRAVFTEWNVCIDFFGVFGPRVQLSRPNVEAGRVCDDGGNMLI